MIFEARGVLACTPSLVDMLVAHIRGRLDIEFCPSSAKERMFRGAAAFAIQALEMK